MNIEKYKEQVKMDLGVIKILIEKDPLYPIEDVDLLLKRIKTNTDIIFKYNDEKKTIQKGEWVQVLENSRCPYYGKVLSFPEPGYITLEGVVFAGENGKITHRAIRKDMCLRVSREVARKLEFANDINTLKRQDHLIGVK